MSLSLPPFLSATIAPAILFAATAALSGEVIYYLDYEEAPGTSDAQVRDGIYGHEVGDGGIIAAVTAEQTGFAARSGNGMLQVVVHKTDGDYGCGGCKRIELKTDPRVGDMPYTDDNGIANAGDTYWYAWSVLIPEGQGPDGKQIMGQWPSRWRNGGYNEGNTMGLELENDRWRLSIQRSRDPDRHRIVDLGPLTKGVWTDWVFQVRWDMSAYDVDNAGGSPGFVRVWKNGQLMADNGNGYTDQGANSFRWERHDEALHFKLGLYKGADRVWDPDTRIAYFDEIRIGTGEETYETMAPGAADAVSAINPCLEPDVMLPGGIWRDRQGALLYASAETCPWVWHQGWMTYGDPTGDGVWLYLAGLGWAWLSTANAGS